MPELKRTFTGGKMEKDLDERIVPNGQYREALNIGVATSEDSDVGAAQNILGNIRVTQAIGGRTQSGAGVGAEYVGFNSHIAEIIDPQSDMLYRFVNTSCGLGSCGQGIWMDRIVEYDTTRSLDDNWELKENAVFVDIYKVADIITDYDGICEGSNKVKIKVANNTNQLRWGMSVSSSAFGIPQGATIEHIDYQLGWITIDQFFLPPDIMGGVILFHGDRNLNFDPSRKITGINIIDGMIFWTDNYSEPKKIDIERSKVGSDTSLWVSTPGLVGRHSPGVPKIDDFNQHTILVTKEFNELSPKYDCMKDEAICATPGCMDPTASNYNPLANFDDGSCCVDGCTDPTAANYDSGATCDDGSCCYVAGCMDPLACNYDPAACFDDGSCDGLLGCTDPAAMNYDSSATCDDGSCLYGYSCCPNGQYATQTCDDDTNDISIAGLYPNQFYSVAAPNQEYIYTDLIPSQFVPPTSIALDVALPGSTYGDPDYVSSGVVPDLGLTHHGADWDNTTSEWLTFGHDPNTGVSTASSPDWAATNIDKMAHFFQSNPTWKFTDKWFYKHEFGVNVWDPDLITGNPANGICDYSTGGGNTNVGTMTKTKIKKVTISQMWSKPDGLDYSTWNMTHKAFGTMYIAGSPVPDLPPARYWPDTSGDVYEDGNGVFYQYAHDFWNYTAEFGDCGTGGVYSPCADGESWEDMISYLYDNGFNGWGPSMIPIGVGTTNHPNQWTQLDAQRHGNGNPSYSADFVNQFINRQPRDINGNTLPDSMGAVNPNYSYSTFPVVFTSDPIAQLIAKVTNNGGGWYFTNAGDDPAPSIFTFETEDCLCDDYCNGPTCVPDQSSSQTLADCQIICI